MSVRMTRSRTRRLLLESSAGRIPAEPTLNPNLLELSVGVDMNNNVVGNVGQPNPGNDTYDSHNSNRVNGKCKESVPEDEELVEAPAAEYLDINRLHQQHQPHHSAHWTFFKVCNKLLSFGSLFTSASLNRLKWKTKSSSASRSLPSLLTLIIVFIVLVILSFCCTNVSAVCVWQGGGGFRLACGFRQSGLFRLRSLGGLKGWAGAGFTIGDEDGFKDSLSNVDPQSQQRLGAAAAAGAAKSKGKSLQRVGRYAGNMYPSSSYMDPRYAAMMQHPQQYYPYNYPNQRGVPSAATPAPKKSMWENWKWPSLLKKKSSPVTSAPVRQPLPLGPVMNPQMARYGQVPVPAPVHGHGPVPVPMHVPLPMAPNQQQQQAAILHYQQQLLASQAGLHAGHNSVVPALYNNGILQQRQGAMPVPMVVPTVTPNFPSFAPMPDFPALDDDPNEDAPASSNNVATKQRQKKPYGLELLEKSPNYGKKYKIRTNTEEIENSLTSPAGPLGYDTDVFPDIYFTSTTKANKVNSFTPTPGPLAANDDLDLDADPNDRTTESLIRKMKLKKIKLLKKGHKHVLMRQKLFNATTPASELHEFSTLPSVTKPHRRKEPKMTKVKQSTTTTFRTTTVGAESEEEIEDGPSSTSTTARTTSKSKSKKATSSPKSKSKTRATTRATTHKTVVIEDDQAETPQQYSPPPRPKIPTPHPRNTEPPLRPDYGEDIEYQARKTPATNYGHTNFLKTRPEVHPSETLPERRRPGPGSVPHLPGFGNYDTIDDLELEHGPPYDQNLHRMYQEAWQYLMTSTTESPSALLNVDYDYGAGYTHPRTVKVYDPRYPPNHEVNRGAMLPSGAAGRFPFLNPSTVATTELPFFMKSNHFHPNTHFSRKSNQPDEHPNKLTPAEMKLLSASAKTTMTSALNEDVGPFVKFDSGESMQLMNMTKNYNSKFYSHFNKSAGTGTAGRILTGQQNSFSSRSSVYPIMNNYDYYGNSATPSSSPSSGSWERPNSHQQANEWHNRHAHLQGSPSTSPRSVPEHSHSHRWSEPTYSSGGRDHKKHHNHHHHTSREDSLEERLKSPTPPTPVSYNYWRNPGLWISQDHDLGHSPTSTHKYDRFGHGPLAEFVTDKTFRIPPRQSANSHEDEFPTNSNKKIQFLPRDEIDEEAVQKERFVPNKSTTLKPTQAPYHSSTPSFQEWKGYVESVGSTVRDKDLYGHGPSTATPMPPVTATTPRPKPPAVLRRRPSIVSTTAIPYHDVSAPDPFLDRLPDPDNFDAYDQQLVSPRPGSHRFFPTARPGPDDSETSTERKNKFKIIVIDNIDNEREKQSLIKHFSSTSAPFLVTPSTMIFDKTGGAVTGRSPSWVSSSTARPWSSSTFGPSSSFSQFDSDIDDDVLQASSSTAHNHIDDISGDVMDPIENLHQEIKKLTAQSNSVLNEYLSEYQASASGSNTQVHSGGGGDFDHEAAHRRRLEQFEELKRKFEEQQQELMRLRNPSSIGTTARPRTQAHAHASSSTRPPADYESTTSYGMEHDRDPTRRVSGKHRHPSTTASSSSLDEIIMEDYVSRRPYNATNRRVNGRRKSTTFQPVTITSHDVDKTTLAPIPATHLLPPVLGSVKPYVPGQMLGPPKPPAEFSTVHLNVEFENPLQQTLNNQLETDWELYSVSGVRPLSRSTEAPSPHDFKTLVEINADDRDDDDYLPSPSVMTPLIATASARTRAPPRNSSPIQPPSFFSVTPSFSTTTKSVSPVRHMIPGGSSMAPPSPTPQVMIREDGSVSFSSSMSPPPPPTAPGRKKIVRVSPTPTPTPTPVPVEEEEHEHDEREDEHIPFFEHSSPASASFDGRISSYSPAVNKLGLPSPTSRYSSSTAGARKHIKVTTEAAATTPNEKDTILKALETLSQAKSEIVESIVSEKYGGELPGEVIKIVPSLPSHLQKLTTSTVRLTTAPAATTTSSTTTPRPRKRINPPSPTPNLIQTEIANKLASLLENQSKSSVAVLDKVIESPSPSASSSITFTSHGDIKVPQADNVHVIELDLPDTAAAHGLSTASPTLQSMIASAIEKFQKDESKKLSTTAPARSPTFVLSTTAKPYLTSTVRPLPSASPSPSPSPSSMRPKPMGSGPTAATDPSSGQQNPLAHKLAQMGLLEKLTANNLSSTQVQTIRKLIKLHQIEQKVDNAFTTTTTTPRTRPPGQVVYSSPSSPYEIIKVDENMDLNKLLGNLLQQQSTKIVHKAISNAAANAHAAANPTAAASNVHNRVLPISPSMMSFVGNLNNHPAINQHQPQQHQQQQIPSHQLNHRIVNLGSSSKNNLFGTGVGPSQFPPQMQHQMQQQMQQQMQHPNAQPQPQFPYPTIGAHALNNGLIQVQNQNQLPLPQMIHVPPGAQGQSLQQLINQQIHQQQAQAHILNNPTLKALQALALNRVQNVKPSPQILFPQQVAPGGEPVFVQQSGDVEPAASDNRGNAMPIAGTPAPADYVDLSPLFGLSGPSMATLLKRNAQLPSYRVTNIRNAPKSYHPSRDTGIIGGIDSATAELRFDPLPTELYTTFQCSDQKYFPGLYADTSNSCEVFHLCAKTETGFMMKTFRCPQSTVFDQEVLRCNWNLYVDCPNAQSKYYFNKYVSQSFLFLKTLGEFSASYQKA